MQSLGERLATLALSVIRTESPHCYDIQGPTARPLAPGAPLTPKKIHPAFYGCFDWHSAVHTHWLLCELWQRRTWGERWVLGDELTELLQCTLESSLSPGHLRVEYEFLLAHPRFERPYGWAWTLRLCSSLRSAPELQPAYAACEALERLCATRLLSWLEGLPYPIRSGEHGQSAFALALFLDWSLSCERAWSEGFHARASQLAERHYSADRAAPLHLEPSGNDFLSPSLAAADVLTRTLGEQAFTAFCSGYFSGKQLLRPVTCPDPKDGKLAHLIGLNLSRTWMLLRITRHLPKSQLYRALLGSARIHRQLGLAQCHCADLEAQDLAPAKDLATELPFALSHWIGSFILLMEDEVRLAPDLAYPQGYESD